MTREVILYGLGSMGQRIARLALERGYRIAGAIDLDRAKAGQPLSRVLGLPKGTCDATVSDDAASVLAATTGAVVLQATSSFLAQVAGPIAHCLEQGHDVISIAEEMTFPAAASPETADRLNRIAAQHGVRLLGTGVNPGFAMDMLVLALTVPCGRVDYILATRTNDLSDFGPTVLTGQGVGLSPDEFHSAVADGRVVGHVGFDQSVALIARHLGWKIDRVEETRTPIMSTVTRATDHLTITTGQVAGCLHCMKAFVDGREVLHLEHPQQIRPDLEAQATSDRIIITGDQAIDMVIAPEIGGGAGTAAAAVNAIEYLACTAPGLIHLTDLPLNSPRALTA
ncbi:4-hydroxy-tetrahydrodipicolinate reductase [Salinihabitans flavidus]|uniref:4-hydroxy-tetrahydrodipicolinate reductase n=1 Tax=Salinihabitans flavidus TaxID=569882 RepID=A0A1H8P6A9_9RHOB|nr:NAD(P)-binding domain-containing protein [Salinihabitans flavidus]SEO37480.1 4-hydroxy-tetrahydrodipicolinate reductase [Salinihabitans flavidus]